MERADHCLPAFVDVDMLDGHFLLALFAIAGEGFHLRRVGPHQLVDGVGRAVLLSDVFGVIEPSCHQHRCKIDHNHLRNQHGRNFVTWLKTVHDRHRGIYLDLTRFTSFRCRADKQVQLVRGKIVLGGSKGVLRPGF